MTGESYEQKFACRDNSGQNICHEAKESSKVRQDQKTSISAITQILTSYIKDLFLEEHPGLLAMYLHNFEILLIIPNFLRHSSLSSTQEATLIIFFHTRHKVQF